MSGVAVIWYLVKSNSPVLGVVPVAQIRSGDLPLKTSIPAISVTQVDSVPYRMMRANEGKEHTDRVQVTVFRKATPDDAGYAGLKTLLDLVVAACPSQRGTINGVAVDSITVDIEGPDLPIPELSIVTRSRDFIVRWHT